jgi:DNA-binding transcriptional regulator GbsR (MarR family)
MTGMKAISDEVRFADEMGLLFDGQGFPRIAGRVLGWLLVCDPPEQSLTDLTAALDISKASASTAARLLLHLGVVERAHVTGARGDYVRVIEDVGPRLFRTRAEFAATLRRTAERGLDSLAGAPAARRARLEQVRRLFAFLEREFARLLERFEEEEKARRPRG